MNEEKFSGKAEKYAAFRPSYPPQLFAFLQNSLALTAGKTVADVGAGTGIFTKNLLELGCKVYAIEPNDDMRKAAVKYLGHNLQYEILSGTAENTGLKDNSVDFVTSAQAFHWFDKQKFWQECKRICKSGGKVILVWNNRDKKSLLVQQNAQINEQFCPDFCGFSGGALDIDFQIKEFFAGQMKQLQFEHNLIFDEQSFIGRNLSSSYALPPDHKNFFAYVSALKTLFDKYSSNGLLQMPNTTVCYYGSICKARTAIKQ